MEGRKSPAPQSLRNTISLREALEKGVAKISERGTASTENVHWLVIENLSGKNIFLASGEIIAGGRQDRMISRDTIILSSQNRLQVPVMCVEEGRWSDKEKKFVYQGQANQRLRKLVDRSRNQVMIWREIYRQLEKDKIKHNSVAYAARKMDKKYAALELEYWQFFKQKFRESDSTITGIVCMSGDKVIGCDLYAANNLFYSELESMMYGFIQEAIVFGEPLRIKEGKIREYMDRLLKDELSQEAFIKDFGKAYRYQGKLVHIGTYAVEE